MKKFKYIHWLHDKTQSLWQNLGPGLVTGSSDDDPSGIATYSQTGAQYGLQYLWLSLYSFPLMAVIQEMCARLGIVTRKGLAANIKDHFPRPILYMCIGMLLVANTINIGADIGAMVAATQLLVPIPFIILAALFTILSLVLQIFTSYSTYSKYLKWLAMGLLLYVATGFVVHLDLFELFRHTFIPSLTWSKDSIVLVCGILGTTISPYLFFWQASQEVEELKEHKESNGIRFKRNEFRWLSLMRVDVWIGMFFSNLVMFFIIAVTAATLHKAGITQITTAAQAAQALSPLAGPFAFFFFTFGIIGTGLLALPVLAGSSAYAIAETFGWKEGLNRKFHTSPRFYGVIIASILGGFLINLIHIDPIKLLLITAVLNGIIAAPLLFVIVYLSSHKDVLGEEKNSPISTIIGYVVTALMTGVGISTIWFMFRQ